MAALTLTPASLVDALDLSSEQSEALDALLHHPGPATRSYSSRDAPGAAANAAAVTRWVQARWS